MPDIQVTREYPVSAARLFEAVTRRSDILAWWGHVDLTIVDEVLDLSRTGPWYADMRGSEGGRYKMSGQVTHVQPPNSVGFTWGWHDEDDKRGPESHVTFSIEPLGETRARLVVDHRELSEEAAETHPRGWAVNLERLSAHLGS